MKRILASAVIAISAAFFFNGCLKDKTTDTETTSATDNSICENEFMRMLPAVNKIAVDEQGVHRPGGPNSILTNSCPSDTVIGASQNYPRIMVLDWGTGCTDPVDGKVRKGKVTCTLSGPWDSVGAVITCSLDSYFVSGIRYEGTVTLTRTGPDSFHKVVTNGKCTKSSGNPWTILFASTHDITFTSGSTNSSQDQIVTITGTNSGTDRNGTTWTSTITTPIVRDLNCTWITKGVVELTPDGKPTRTIDFGDGTCDNKATITINGNVFEFSMN